LLHIRIHIGAPVSITVQSLQKTVTGTVARFAERLDTDTRTMRVEVDVPNPGLALVPGMYADASLSLDEARDAVVAPVQAVDRTEAGARVLVVGPQGVLDARPVTLGLEAADRVEIKKGLKEGDVVVVGSRAQLKPGTTVVPKLAAAPAAGER